MPTINQLVRLGREEKEKKSKSVEVLQRVWLAENR